MTGRVLFVGTTEDADEFFIRRVMDGEIPVFYSKCVNNLSVEDQRRQKQADRCTFNSVNFIPENLYHVNPN